MAKFVCIINNANSFIGSSATIFGNSTSGSFGTITDWSVGTINSFNSSAFPCTSVVVVNDVVTIEFDAASGLDLGDISQNFPTVFYMDGSQILSSITYQDTTPPPPPADLNICTECRQSRQQACADTYLITAGLTEGDTYYVTITDRNNNLYIQSIVADANGDLTIDALSSEFPNGFWLSESGAKSIIVYEDVNRTIVADLTVGANVYTCMILTLQYIYSTT